MAHLDRRILRYFTCDLDPAWGDVVSMALNNEVFGVAMFALLVLFAWLSPRARAQAPRALLAVLLCVGTLHGIRAACWKWAPRDRPGTAYGKANLLEGSVARSTCGQFPHKLATRSYPPTSPSFPSSHTVTAGGVAAIVTLASRWPVGVLAWCYAALVGLARVYWAKHWPSDVVGSLLLCAVVGVLAWRVAGVIDGRVRGPRGARERG